MHPRDYDAALRVALREVAWGEVRPFGNVQATVCLTPTPATSDYSVTLDVRVMPARVVLGYARRHITVPVDATRVGGTVGVPARALWYANGADAEFNIVREALKSLVYQAAPRLYEADPRIGSCDAKYPHLPLFDPMGGVAAMRRFHGCPLCGQAVPDPGGAGYRAWGGGNLGWVHPTCLSEVYP